jgi:hypothetical protein
VNEDVKESYLGRKALSLGGRITNWIGSKKSMQIYPKENGTIFRELCNESWFDEYLIVFYLYKCS